ncbi:MAG: DUF1080 domain-containing protein [Acidobacteriota bacterium]
MRAIFLLAAVSLVHGADNGPQPRVVTPGAGGPASPPSDAIVLFDGKDTNAFTKLDGSPIGCKAMKGELVCETGAGDIVSKELFSDAQLHLEFNIPNMPNQKGQMKGNSGAYLQSCYEVQILDGFQNPTYADGTVGAVYGFKPPFVNAARKPTEWQTYDIVYHAPKCDGQGNITKPGSATILLNGVLVQENTMIDKKGPGCKKDSICGPGPLRLQDHSGFKDAPHTLMKFRNIWLRKLE